MRKILRSMLFTGAFAMGAHSLMASSTGNSWSDEWYRAKFGRTSPMEEARQKAERASEAFREERPSEVAHPASTWMDQWYRAKFGSNSPREAARQRVEMANTAFREEPVPARARSTNDWQEQWYKVKFGRSSPLEEARQKLNVK